jgi:hypothetical protein
MLDRIPICLGVICITGDPRIVDFDGTKWILHEETYRELMSRCANAGVRLVRKMLWSPFGKTGSISNMFSPYALSGEHFDLDKWNGWYWPIMRKMQGIDKSVNITNRYDIADNCDFAVGGNWYKYVPWKNNVQGIKTLYQKEAWPYYEVLARKAVEMFGKGQYYSTGNEMENAGVIPIFEKVIVKLIKEGVFTPERFAYGPTMPDAKYVTVPVIEDGKPTHYPSPIAEGTLGILKRMAGSPPDGLLDEKTKLLIYRDVHSVGSPPYDNIRKFGPREHQLKVFWGKYPIRAWASTDGKKLSPIDPRASKCDVDFDGARISDITWYAQAVDLIGAYRSNKGGMARCLVLEHCPQTMNVNCLAKTFKAMSRAVKAMTGIDPENFRP